MTRQVCLCLSGFASGTISTRSPLPGPARGLFLPPLFGVLCVQSREDEIGPQLLGRDELLGAREAGGEAKEPGRVPGGTAGTVSVSQGRAGGTRLRGGSEGGWYRNRPMYVLTQ